MDTNPPLITVITPTYNRADYLVETIESVLSQNYPSVEYIILDDGSVDNTKDILLQYDGRVIWESHPNMGETKTVNKGFRMASGEYICVVNSDDPLMPNALRKLVSALSLNISVLVAYPDWMEINSNSKPTREMYLPNYTIENMLTDFNVGIGPGTVFRRSVFEEFGLRDLDRKYTGDLEFWFRLASRGKLLHVPEILATHRTHPNSISVSNRNSKMAEELLDIVKGLLIADYLPKELHEKRNQILSGAYFTGIFYCPNEPGMIIKYSFWSFLYHPFYFTYRFIVHFSSKSLQALLPRRSYNALRSWWRHLWKIY
jgi:glycosyltransferase involved in cell wall biosynthesis